MKRKLHHLLSLAILSQLFLAAAFGQAIASRTAVIDGAKLHYFTAGHGPNLILLHGFAETSQMWKPIIPVLALRFTVIAPDLPGIGDSDAPSNGSDMKNAAIRIHDLSKSLGIQQAEVVGHDIGLMVAYAYAAMYPSEVKKLVLMDAFLPGVQGWEPIYDNPNYWHFRFNGPTPEALVKRRERTYFEYFWNDLAFDKTHSIPDPDRQIYTTAYSRPGKMHSAWAYFAAWPQTAKDFAQLSRTKLTMPVLSIGGDHSLGGPLGDQAKLVATNVTVIIIKNSGHWIFEEQPKQTTDALQKFL